MLFDAHTHCWDRQFDTDRDAVLARARDAGIRMIQVGTDLETSSAAVRLAESNDDMWATAGQHPTDTMAEFDAPAFEAISAHSKVAAIGECGLDYFRADSLDRTRQAGVFRAQIRLAQTIGKPLMIHCRPSLRADKSYSMDAYDDVLRILAEEEFMGGGAVHFFAGTPEVAQRFLDIGFYISFSGVITITPMYDEAARFVPDDRILIETDAPYAAPAPHRGKRNEPAYVAEVARRLAEIRDRTLEEIADRTARNTEDIFGLK